MSSSKPIWWNGVERGDAWIGDQRVDWSRPSAAPLGDIEHFLLAPSGSPTTRALAWSVRSAEPAPLHVVDAFFADVRAQATPMRVVSTSLSVDVREREVDARWRPGATPTAADALAASIALRFAVGAHGWAHLHAAAIEWDATTCVLVAGGSGSGKSTSTLALVATGLAAMSDDGAFIRADGLAVGVARPVHAAPRTRAVFESLGEIGKSVETDKVELMLHQPMQRDSRIVRAVLLPRVEPERPTSVEVLPAAEAFASLLGCCTPALLRGPWQEVAIDVVARLTTRPLLALRLGADALVRPAVVRELIEKGLR